MTGCNLADTADRTGKPGKNASPKNLPCDSEPEMRLSNENSGFRQALIATLLFCHVFPAIARGNPQAGQDSETTPFLPWPPAAIKAHEQGDIRLRITLEKGSVVDVAIVSGPLALALPSANWVKTRWKLRPDISGVYDLNTKFSFHPPKINASAVIRIVVKNGRMIEVAPVAGTPKVAAAAADFVKKKWEFAANQNLIVLLPVEVQQAK